MNKKQAFLLLKGTVVMRDGDPNQRGTVIDIGYAGVFVNWEDRRVQPELVPYHLAQHISHWEPETVTP